MLEEERAAKQAKRDLHKTGMSENPLRFEFICDQSFTHFINICEHPGCQTTQSRAPLGNTLFPAQRTGVNKSYLMKTQKKEFR